MALPVDPTREAQIDDLIKQVAALPGVYNTRRQDAASLAAADLTASGLVENATAQAVPGANGNVVYKLIVGPNGRVYRQAYRQTLDAAAARGMAFGSETDRRLDTTRRDLDTRRAQATTAAGQQQTQLTGQQQEEDRGLGRDLTRARTDYAGWQAQQSVPPPPEPPPPAPEAAAGGPQPSANPATRRTQDRPEVTYQQFVRTHGGRSNAALAAKWKARWGPVPGGGFRY